MAGTPPRSTAPGANSSKTRATNWACTRPSGWARSSTSKSPSSPDFRNSTLLIMMLILIVDDCEYNSQVVVIARSCCCGCSSSVALSVSGSRCFLWTRKRGSARDGLIRGFTAGLVWGFLRRIFAERSLCRGWNGWRFSTLFGGFCAGCGCYSGLTGWGFWVFSIGVSDQSMGDLARSTPWTRERFALVWRPLPATLFSDVKLPWIARDRTYPTHKYRTLVIAFYILTDAVGVFSRWPRGDSQCAQ